MGFISCKIFKTSFRQHPKGETHRRQPSNYDSLQMTHLTRESSPISVYNIYFCFSVQSFLFLQKCPWLLPMIHYLWLIPEMISPQVPDCCLHTSSNRPIRELIEWDWHYPIKTHYSTRLVENPKFALNTAPTTRQSCFVKNGPIQILNELSASKSCFPIGQFSRPIRN